MDLVELKNKKITTTSMIVAEKFGKTHKRVLQTIDKLYEDIQNLMARNGAMRSTSGYEIKAKYRVVRGREFKSYDMNRKMFTLLAMGFTGEDALQWKMHFIDAFELMENTLLQQGNLEWKKEREEGKQIRKDETSAIKQLVDLATSQGSGSANKYYMIVTKMTNQALGFMQQTNPKLRDTLNGLQLSQLKLVEHRAMESIRFHVNNDEHYKEVYVNVKNDVLKLTGELIGFEPLITHK